MVFAERVDLNVLDNDELVVGFVEQGIIDGLFDVDLVAAGEEHEGLCVA